MSFISDHAFGLDINDRSMEVFDIHKKFGKLSVTASGRVELEPGIIEDGHILNKEKARDTIRRLVQTAAPENITSKHVCVSIPEAHMYLYTFQLPAVISEKNIAESIQYKAEETLPLSFNQLYHDYRILNKSNDTQDVLYVACAKQIIDDYRDIIQQAGLEAITFEPESTAIARATLNHEPIPPTMIVDLGARSTTVAIFDRHGIRYSHALPVAGKNVTNAIMQQRSVNHSEAVRLKREIGLRSDFQQSPVYAIIAKVLDPLIEQFGISIQYYEQKTGFAVTQVLLVGGLSLLPDIAPYLHQQLELPVEVAQPLRGIKYSKKIIPEETQAVLFTSVVGLALRGIQGSTIHHGINLLQHEAEHHRINLGTLFYRQTKEVTAKKKQRQPKIVSGNKKKLFTLLGVFGVLIIIFVVLLMFRPPVSE